MSSCLVVSALTEMKRLSGTEMKGLMSFGLIKIITKSDTFNNQDSLRKHRVTSAGYQVEEQNTTLHYWV